ncbi:MAG: hypothetical protein ACYS67_13035 [Planctomycetota bacterium]
MVKKVQIRRTSLEIVSHGEKFSISTVGPPKRMVGAGRDSHQTVSRRPVRAGGSKENANRR